jgi:NADH dehydrogenase FAD-containing subunit
MESAIQLGRDGHKVAVIERDPIPICTKRLGSLGAPLAALSKEAGNKVEYECTIEEIRKDSVIYRDAADNRVQIPCDTVLLAAGVQPRKKLVDELRHTIAEGDVYLVGDLTEAGTIGHAVNSGFDIAAHL